MIRARGLAGSPDFVPIAAKAIARQQRKSIGEVVSALARRALHRPEPPKMRNGMNLLARGDDQAVVTLETVNDRRDVLLDVNVLIALIDPAHVGHDVTHHWFEEQGHDAWYLPRCM